MSNNDKVKLYKNPARNKPSTTQSPYIPQYQVMGVEPEVYNSPMAPGYAALNKGTPLPKSNPRAPRSLIKQPYAEAVASPIGRGKGPIPNVGNNMEQTWSSLDGEIIDDLSSNMVDPNHPMIDNNDYVSEAALGSSELEMSDSKEFMTKEDLQNVLKQEDDTIFSLEEEEYIVFIKEVFAFKGDLDTVQNQVSAMVFGDEHLWPHEPISVDDIVVLKRVRINIGLFLK